MRLHEEFTVDQPVVAVWNLLEQPEMVARCMPGVEQIRVVDPDHIDVRATQSIGPMTATFEAKVTVLERVEHELIRFQATGKSVRGATGNMRAVNAVTLRPEEGATAVTVDGEVVLAGALGSVGQKIVAKQASKVTSSFAENLQLALSGAVPGATEAPGLAEPGRLTAPAAAAQAPGAPRGGGEDWTQVAPGRPARRGDRAEMWSRLAAALSAASVVLSVIGLVRSRRRAR
jgi:uncharacterized protein